MVRSLRRSNQSKWRSDGSRPPDRASERGGERPDERRRRDSSEFMRVAGLPAVAALFATAPERVERMFFLEELKEDAGAFCVALAKSHKPYRIVPDHELVRIAGTPMHGGIVAMAAPPEVAVFDPLEAAAWAAAGEPLLILAGVGNPHNLGAIVRTAAFFGVTRVLLGDLDRQAMPSDASTRVAKGGMEHVRFYKTERLAAALNRMPEGYFIVAADVDGEDELPLLKVPKGRAVALMLGNEEDGLADDVLDHCDAVVRIPGSGKVESLNVAASAAILVHQLLLQRG